VRIQRAHPACASSVRIQRAHPACASSVRIQRAAEASGEGLPSCFPFGFPFVPFPFTVCYPAFMAGIPRHDWALYEHLTRAERLSCLRRLTPEEALDLYEDGHAIAIALTPIDGVGDLERLARARWTDKLALRHKLRRAFLALDELRRGSTP
jgi:hypothetical protein